MTGILKNIFKDDCVVVEARDVNEETVRHDLAGLLQSKGMKIYVIRSQCPAGARYRMNDV